MEANLDSGLDGDWAVERCGGLLPPLVGVRKRITGNRGWTVVGPLRFPFDLVGFEIRYRGPLSAFVDVLGPPDTVGCQGRATFLGRTFGSFRMIRVPSVSAGPSPRLEQAAHGEDGQPAGPRRY